MRISIRMISIAIIFFWLILIAFFVSAVYSVKDLHFDFEAPQMDLTSDNKILFSLPITIDNNGYYNIGSFNMTTKISDQQGFAIAQGSTFIPVIERGRQITTTHNMTVDIGDLLQINQDYLFNDTELEVHEIVGMKIAEVIPVQASTNISIPWGAPLYNFTLGEIEYSAWNLTHLTAAIPMGFENHAFFDLTGIIRIRMYNSTSNLVCEGQTTIEARERYLQLKVPIAGLTEHGCFEVYFLTPIFDFGPLVVPYD